MDSVDTERAGDNSEAMALVAQPQEQRGEGWPRMTRTMIFVACGILLLVGALGCLHSPNKSATTSAVRLFQWPWQSPPSDVCGNDGNNGGDSAASAVPSKSPCDCEEICSKTPGCVGWTYVDEASGFTTTSPDGQTQNCYLRNTWGDVVDNCGGSNGTGRCRSGRLKVVSFNASDLPTPHYTDPSRAMEEQVREAKGQCADAGRKYGNMSYIAADPNDMQPFPTLHSAAYAAISKCITADEYCDPSNPSGIDDVRSIYGQIVGTAAADLYLGRVTDWGLMAQVGSSPQYRAAATQLGQELAMVKALGEWYSVYLGFFNQLSSQLDKAFTSMFILLAMPHSSDTVITAPKKGWKGITLDILSHAAGVMVLVATDGASAEMPHADGLLAVGVSMTSAVSLAENPIWEATTTTSTAPAANMQDDALSMRYDAMLEMLEALLDAELTLVAEEAASIASNWGRLQRATGLVQNCMISSISTELVIVESFPMLQWMALGVLFPSKYAIYWQRDYNMGSGPTCQSPSPVFNPKFAFGDACSDFTCNAKSAGDLNGESDILSCYGSAGPCGKSGNPPPSRSIWIAESPSTGGSTAPSDTAPDDFFEGLTSKMGVVSRYINRVYKTSYTGTTGGLATFASQCQYMTKLFIPPLSDGYSGDSTLDAVSSSNTDMASIEPVHCLVYGILLPTYALPDCNTVNSNGNVCVNGYGQFGLTQEIDQHSTGNFNQFTYIPRKKWHWGREFDGKYGCCLPWDTESSDLPAGCDFIICDCYSLASTYDNYQTGNGEGVYVLGGGELAKKWSGLCPNAWSYGLMTMPYASLGTKCNWTEILDSGGKLEACYGGEKMVGGPSPPPMWSSKDVTEYIDAST